MAINVGDALMTLGIDTKQFDAGMNKMATGLAKHRKAIGIGMVAIGGAALAGMGMAMKAASDFEGAMREVNTMMGLGAEEFQEFSKEVQTLAVDLGVDAVGAAEALYQAISAGIPKENAIEFLTIATKAAIAGVTDTETAVDGLSTVINAFKMPLSDTQRVADVMFTTVKGGKTTFAELAASMNLVAPMAAALGVSFEDVMAATASLTKQGVPTAMAMTQIRSTFVALTKPTKEMEGLLEKVGFASGEAMLQALGYVGSLEALREAANNNNQVLSTAFGRVEGLNAMLGLTGENAAAAAADIEAMANSAGAASDAFEEMEKSYGRQMEAMKASAKDVQITVGNILLPILTEVLETIKPIIKWIKDWTNAHPGLTKVIVLTSAALAGLLLVFGGILLILPGITAAIGLFGITLSAAIWPITLVVAAIALLTVGIVALMTNWEKVTAFLERSWQNIKIFFLEGVQSILTSLSQFTRFIPGLNKIVDTAKEKIANMIQGEKLKKEVLDAKNTIDRLRASVQDNYVEMQTSTDVTLEHAEAVRTDKEAIEDNTEALEEQQAALDEQEAAYERRLNRAKDAVKQFEYERSEAGKAGITTNKVTKALLSQGWTTSELAKLWTELGDDVNYADLYMEAAGLTVMEMVEFMTLLEAEIQEGRDAWERYGESVDESIDSMKEAAALARATGGAGGPGFGHGGIEPGMSNFQKAYALGMTEEEYERKYGLANGGIAMRPITRLIGEKGPEAVIPLDKLGSMGGYKTANIILQIDGRTLARIMGQPLVDEMRLKGIKL